MVTGARREGRIAGGRRKRRTLKLLLFFAACVLVVDSLVGEKGLLTLLRARRQYAELANRIAHERLENARLRQEARRLREDPAAIEEIARRELGLMKLGERIFIIKDIAPSSPPRRP